MGFLHNTTQVNVIKFLNNKVVVQIESTLLLVNLIVGYTHGIPRQFDCGP